MSTNNKQLLIVERSQFALGNIGGVDEFGRKKFVFEGIFAVLNQMNRNKRIYTEDQYLPQIEGLQSKIAESKVLGEANHPTDRFDIDIKNVSHVVESLEYNKEKGIVTGKIRLLNTPSGKIIQSLVEDGIPIHISSRAAGSVNPDGTVVMKQLFTYDIVAEPGFEQAQLNRVNEKYGFDDSDTIFLYEVAAEDADEFSEPENKVKEEISPEVAKKTKQKLIVDNADNVCPACGGKCENGKCMGCGRMHRFMGGSEETSDTMENFSKNVNIYNKKDKNMNYVTQEQFEKYTAYLKKQISMLTEKLRASNSTPNRIERSSIDENKYNELANKYAKLVEFVNYLSSNLNKSIAHGDHVVENVMEMKAYIDYLTKNVDGNITYTKYLASQLDESISYERYLADLLNKNINYSNHLAEGINELTEETLNNRKYSEYIAEGADKGIQYAEYLAKKLDVGIQYSEEIGKKVNESIKYSNYLSETLNKTIGYGEYLGESINKTLGFTPNTKEFNYEASIDEKLNLILENAKTQKAIGNDKTHFLKFLNATDVKKFNSLNEEMKKQVIEEFKNKTYYSISEATEIFENVFKPKTLGVSDFEVVKYMKPHHRALWNNLNESRKAEIIKLSNNYVLTNQDQIDKFFDGVDMRNERVQLQSINENEIKINQTATQDNYLQKFEMAMLERKR